VVELPPGFKLMASTDSAPIAGMADESAASTACSSTPRSRTPARAAHPHPLRARHLRLRALWTPATSSRQPSSACASRSARDEVLLGLSGGVDSSVVAALLHRAIGDQLTCVFVDNGLLRLHEGDQVMATFAEHMGVKVIRVDAEARFSWMRWPASTIRSEAQDHRQYVHRGVRGRGRKLKNAKWLAQGTIYPDVIESAGAKTGKAHVIKSHHNVGGLPEQMKLKLLEPLRELFKDEVRKLGVSSACPTTWSTAIRSRARASACASSAK
jgi:GMP synthase (glutamine-hydrolysing)